jgi:hypothetical protein
VEYHGGCAINGGKIPQCSLDDLDLPDTGREGAFAHDPPRRLQQQIASLCDPAADDDAGGTISASLPPQPKGMPAR